MEALGLRVKFDDDDNRKPGWKFAEYEMKGVPLRIAIGPRDLENGKCEIARRDNFVKEIIDIDTAAEKANSMMDVIQKDLFEKALTFQKDNTRNADTWDEFKDLIKNKGGFVYAHWDGTEESENNIKKMTKATIRCIPLDSVEEEGKCILTGNPSKRRVLFAKAY